MRDNLSPGRSILLQLLLGQIVNLSTGGCLKSLLPHVFEDSLYAIEKFSPHNSPTAIRILKRFPSKSFQSLYILGVLSVYYEVGPERCAGNPAPK